MLLTLLHYYLTIISMLRKTIKEQKRKQLYNSTEGIIVIYVCLIIDLELQETRVCHYRKER